MNPEKEFCYDCENNLEECDCEIESKILVMTKCATCNNEIKGKPYEIMAEEYYLRFCDEKCARNY